MAECYVCVVYTNQGFHMVKGKVALTLEKAINLCLEHCETIYGKTDLVFEKNEHETGEWTSQAISGNRFFVIWRVVFETD